MVGYQYKNDKCPGKFSHQVCSWAPDSEEANQVGDYGSDKNRANQRDVVIELRPHIPTNKIQKTGCGDFSYSLFAGNVGYFKTGAKPDAKGRDDNQNKPADSYGLRQLNFPKDRDILKGCQDLCTSDRYFHGKNLTLREILFNI